jgi:hypothetical protein
MTITETITNTTKALPEWSLSTLKTGNDAILAATKRVVEAFEPAANLIPKTPLADRLPEMPEPTALLTVWFNYMEKVVAEQKRFGLDLAGTVNSPAPAAPAPAPARKTPAAKTSASKSA